MMTLLLVLSYVFIVSILIIATNQIEKKNDELEKQQKLIKYFERRYKDVTYKYHN